MDEQLGVSPAESFRLLDGSLSAAEIFACPGS